MYRPNRVLGMIACLLAALLVSGTALAQRVEGERAEGSGLYAAEVPVRSQGETEREAGFARGLAQVLGKLSGDRAVAQRPGVPQELRRASQYVEGYDYRQDEGVSSRGTPTFTTTLVVRYRQDDVDAVAGALGLPVWPAPRPKPVLWLAIDDGSGPRLVALQQSNVARPVLQRAIERGYRLGLPGGSAAEQAAVGAIWRGDTAAIARISARYNPPMQLIGKLYRDGAGWKVDWIFVDGGRVLSRWSETGGDARRLLPTGADGAADALTRRYARPATTGTPSTQAILFTGINSSADFIRLSAQLQRMSVVRGVRPLRATQQGLEVELDLLTGMEGFRRMAGDETFIEAEATLDSVMPVFHLR